MVDSHKFKQVLAQPELRLHRQRSLPQSLVASGTWYEATELGNAFFSTPTRKEDQKQFVFTLNRQK